jgi:hypothetical protein
LTVRGSQLTVIKTVDGSQFTVDGSRFKGQGSRKKL